MSNNKQDPRAHVAMNMTSDIFLSSTTKFSGIVKLPASQAVDQRLKQRALEAIKSKSPQNKKIDVGRISQLGTGGLWKGLDFVPQRNSKSPGNQQRLKTSANQSSLSPGRGRIQTVQNNIKNQKQPEIKVNQNSLPKPIQRNHNRNAQNQVNNSRYRTQIRQVQGNIVSQNLIRNQKSTKDDFQIGDKSNDKKRKYSNQNQKSKVLLPNAKTQVKNTTQSRALSDVNEKKVSFSPQKPKQHSIQKRQIKKPVQIKPVQTKPALKVTNTKQEPYVYVPPQKRVLHNQEENQHHHSQSYAPKVQTSQSKAQSKPVPYRSLSPKKEEIRKPETSIQVKPKPTPVKPVQQKPVTVQQPQQISPVKIKSRAEIIAEQQSSKKNITTPGYSYQPPQRTELIKREEVKIEEKKTVIIQKQPIIERKPQVSPPKVQPIVQNKPVVVNNTKIVSKTIINEQNVQIRKVTNIIKTTPAINNSKSNVSLNVSSKQKSPNKNQPSSPKIISRKRVEFSPEDLRKDWSKIKEGLRYDKSLSPSRQSVKKVPERQDVAMKMLAQIFLNASTRFFPGMSLLLKRGISKEQIDQMRSKSSQFKINVISASDRKSPSKQQPKSERKINWRQSEPQKTKENNRMYQNDVTATQYKMKKPEEIQQAKKTQPIKIQPQTQPQPKSPQKPVNKSTNIVSVSLQKNHKNLTRDDSILDRHKKEPSERSNSIRESPDIYHRQISKQDVEDSKKQITKMKSEALRKSTNSSPPKKQEGYVYQPPAKKVSPSAKQSTEPSKPVILNPVKPIVGPSVSPKKEQKPIQTAPVSRQPAIQREPVKSKPQEKSVPKITPITKSQTSIMQKPQSKPVIPVKSPAKQEPKQISRALDASKTSISIKVQERQDSKSPSKQQNYSYTPSKQTKNQQPYFYQPPVRRPVQSPPKAIETPRETKVIVQPQGNQPKPVQTKLVSNQVITPSKSVTNIVQTPQKPITQPVQKPVQIKSKAPQIKTPVQNKLIIEQKKPIQQVQPKPVKIQTPKPQPQTSQKTISIITSKSQTSLIDQKKPQPQTPKNQPNIYQPATKKAETSSSYVYQPPTKKDTSLVTQPIIPAKNDNNATLRSVQSEKVIKTIDPREFKTPETTMIKKQHKIATIENRNTPVQTKVPEPVKKPQPKTFSNNTTSQVKIQPKAPQVKKDQRPSIQVQRKSQPLVPASAASKRFIAIIALILKKRLSSNFSHSFSKIRQQSQHRAQIQKHASFLSRSIITFSHNYETILNRTAFKQIKTTLVTEVNKIIKQNKPVQENNNFTSGQKQSAVRIIFWLLQNKMRSYLKPIRKTYLSIKSKGKTREQVLEALAVVVKRRSIIFLKDGFKNIKAFRNQRQAALQNFANILSKLRYTAVNQNFATFVNKDIKQLGSNVKALKQQARTKVAQQPPKTLSASKSQQTLPTYTMKKEESQKLSETQKQFNPNEQAKLQQKRKELDRKINELENRKQSIQQQVNNENKEKRLKTKKNAQLRVLLKQLQEELSLQEASAPPIPQTKRQNSLHQHDLIPILTRIYAYLFEDDETSQIIVERFLADNQHCFQLPTNPALLNEWKIINKNAELKRLIKVYEGQQPREKKINEVLQEENLLMSKLLRSFIRERYIWQWVNIIAHQ